MELWQSTLFSTCRVAVVNVLKERSVKFEELSSELQDKVKDCKTTEELAELAKLEGFEISDDLLNAISGGNECLAVCWDNEGTHNDGITVD